MGLSRVPVTSSGVMMASASLPAGNVTEFMTVVMALMNRTVVSRP